MTRWFGPKLEPGERVVLRLPPRARMDWRSNLRWLAVPVVVLAATYVTGVGDKESWDYWGYMVMLAAVPVLITILSAIAVFVRNRYWRIVLTDRRVLVMTSRPRRKHLELNRNEIVAVARDTVNQSLVFRTGSREVAVRFPYHGEEDAVLAALGRDMAEATA